MKRLILALLASAAAFAASSHVPAQVKSVVLVHGAFADGSGWKQVADILQGHGYAVSVVQEPETSFEADVAATRRVLAKAGPCVLVCHMVAHNPNGTVKAASVRSPGIRK